LVRLRQAATGPVEVTATVGQQQVQVLSSSIRDVNLGWALIEATGINDNGWIVGNAWNIQTWESSVFLLNPCDICPIAQVPEPETYAMFMAGLGLMGFIARRRKNGRS
jgi:hypothetical protein